MLQFVLVLVVASGILPDVKEWASSPPERTLQSQEFDRAQYDRALNPPGGTPRLYGRQDACRYEFLLPVDHIAPIFHS